MSFTNKVTPSVYQLQRQLGAIANGVVLESGKAGDKFLSDAGTYDTLPVTGYVGELKWFAFDNIPLGYISLAGQTLDRYTYVNLFEVETSNVDITITISGNTTLFKYTTANKYLANGLMITLETTEDFPSNTLDIKKQYFISNLDTSKKQFQLKNNTSDSTAIHFADLSSVTGSQKIRIYSTEFVGPGNNYSTFTLLDARGYFLRNDVSRVLGNKQEDAFQGHRHMNTGSIYSFEGQGEIGGAGTYARTVYTNSGGIYTVSGESYGTPRVANETRSKNIAACLCIKY